MNQKLALRVLSLIMDWDDSRAGDEFRWLRLISRIKYDGYRDFLAGVRFIESLAKWIQQFPKSERETAYRFVRERLVYISPAEMGRLVGLLYPVHVQKRLLDAVGTRLRIPRYRIWTQAKAQREFELLRRKTLFMALSDGAQLDIFRRANAGILNNEQIVASTQLDKEKWDDLIGELRSAVGDESACFSFVYLVDDFSASGLSLNRYHEGRWKGKLTKFWKSVHELIETVFEPDWVLCVHHHLASYHASQAIVQKEKEVRAERGSDWFPRVEFSFGLILPENLPLSRESDPDFMKLVQDYYDPAIETRHTKVGGDSIQLGFSDCALPVVLEHNTPNNSVSLIWAESEGRDGHHAMRPLFRRRERHV